MTKDITLTLDTGRPVQVSAVKIVAVGDRYQDGEPAGSQVTVGRDVLDVQEGREQVLQKVDEALA